MPEDQTGPAGAEDERETFDCPECGTCSYINGEGEMRWYTPLAEVERDAALARAEAAEAEVNQWADNAARLIHENLKIRFGCDRQRRRAEEAEARVDKADQYAADLLKSLCDTCERNQEENDRLTARVKRLEGVLGLLLGASFSADESRFALIAAGPISDKLSERCDRIKEARDAARAALSDAGRAGKDADHA